MTDCHTWLGIGGRTGRVRRPRRLSREIRGQFADNTDLLRSGGDYFRRHIRILIGHFLRKEVEYRNLPEAHWDATVPLGVERDLAVAARRGGGGATLKAIVDISISFEFVYSEPKALLLACDKNDGGGLAGRNGNGEAPSCSICFEELSPEAGVVVGLPRCTHGFHLWCIDPWFQKASTCPVCRRDQLQHIRPDYRDLRDKMTDHSS